MISLTANLTNCNISITDKYGHQSSRANIISLYLLISDVDKIFRILHVDVRIYALVWNVYYDPTDTQISD